MDIKSIIEHVNSTENRIRILNDKDKYLIFNGALKPVVEKAIRKEFIQPETVNEMVNRICSVNVIQKIIDKLAGVYIEAPSRRSYNQDESDDELVSLLADSMQLNKNGKFINKLFKLNKHAAYEPFVDIDGVPKCRILPSHTYSMISYNPLTPNIPDVFIKHIKIDPDSRQCQYAVWTKDQHFTMDGSGNIIEAPEGMINPYGKIPFVLVSQATNYIYPIQNDDLVNVQIAICLLLTDLLFASKYQAFSTIVAKGIESQNITLNPCSIIFLQQLPDGTFPELSTIKPDIDTTQMLSLIESLVAMLLTTNNLSTNNVAGNLTSGSAASGVSKAFDLAESTENRKDQVEYFSEAEEELFELVANYMYPVWLQNGWLVEPYNKPFSQDFEIEVEFPELKPLMTFADKIQNVKMLQEIQLITKRQALRYLYPDWDAQQVEDYINEIMRDGLEEMQFIQRNTDGESPT